MAADGIDRSVVRNAACRRSELAIRERHDERKNVNYANSDIDLKRTPMNVHFKTPGAGYAESFDRLIESGAATTRGMKRSADKSGLHHSVKIVDEMVFDVNTAYFDARGGYEFAKAFYAEAYKCAVKAIGGEEYVISAVMHADEINKALSASLGRDVHHYHLHVVYVPVVVKEIKFSARTKDPELRGKTREVAAQVSHSKKWPRGGGPDGVNSYSLLQDHFFEHMRAAGFDGFERGERKSTARHLSALEYKSARESERLAARVARRASVESALTSELIKLGEAREASRIAEGRLAELGGEMSERLRRSDSMSRSLQSMKSEFALLEKRTEELRAAKGSLGAEIDELIKNRSGQLLLSEAAASEGREEIARLGARIGKLAVEEDRLLKSLDQKKASLSKLDEHLKTGWNHSDFFKKLDELPVSSLLGRIVLKSDDWSDVLRLAKTGVRARAAIDNLKAGNRKLSDRLSDLSRIMGGEKEAARYMEARRTNPGLIEKAVSSVLEPAAAEAPEKTREVKSRGKDFER
jgi:hypothetical protein